MDAWDRAPKAARKRFLEERGEALSAELAALVEPAEDTAQVVFLPRREGQNG